MRAIGTRTIIIRRIGLQRTIRIRAVIICRLALLRAVGIGAVGMTRVGLLRTIDSTFRVPVIHRFVTVHYMLLFTLYTYIGINI